MDSVALDWFWFWLLFIVVVRSLAATSLGILSLLTGLSHHNIHGFKRASGWKESRRLRLQGDDGLGGEGEGWLVTQSYIYREP